MRSITSSSKLNSSLNTMIIAHILKRTKMINLRKTRLSRSEIGPLLVVAGFRRLDLLLRIQKISRQSLMGMSTILRKIMVPFFITLSPIVEAIPCPKGISKTLRIRQVLRSQSPSFSKAPILQSIYQMLRPTRAIWVPLSLSCLPTDTPEPRLSQAIRGPTPQARLKTTLSNMLPILRNRPLPSLT